MKIEIRDFTPLQNYIHGFLGKIPRVGSWMARQYVKFWNPVNYAIIGGIGVIINFILFAATIKIMPWYFCNIISIGSAWMWNWSNSVGPLGVHWGFKKNEKN